MRRSIVAALLLPVFAPVALAQTREAAHLFLEFHNLSPWPLTIVVSQEGVRLGKSWKVMTSEIPPGAGGRVFKVYLRYEIRKGARHHFVFTVASPSLRSKFPVHLELTRKRLIKRAAFTIGAGQSPIMISDYKIHHVDWASTRRGAPGSKVFYRIRKAHTRKYREAQFVFFGRELVFPSPAPRSLSVLTYVVDLGGRSKRKLAPLIASEMVRYPFDVIVFQEATRRAAREALLVGLRSRFRYRTSLLGDRSKGKQGGLIMVSRWPIEAEDQRILSKRRIGHPRGVVYALIDKGGVKHHVFGTHLDGPGPRGRETKRWRRLLGSQLDQLRRFIDARRIPATQPLVIAGDSTMAGGQGTGTSRLRGFSRFSARSIPLRG